MSIFFSPDEPKLIDIHSGRMIRLGKQSKSFAKSKDYAVPGSRTFRLKVVPETTELREVRYNFNVFNHKFAEFSKVNGPSVTGPQMADVYMKFKKVFDTLLNYASSHFNSGNSNRRLGRYSPIIIYSCKLLKEWSSLIAQMNGFSTCRNLPHIKRIQSDFDSLNNSIQAVASGIISRTYYRDSVYAASNNLVTELTRIYDLIYTGLLDECNDGVNDHLFSIMKAEMVTLSRKINENFIGMLPSSVSATPDYARLRSDMKAFCGDILYLIEASYTFRYKTNEILACMDKLDTSIRNLLDKLGVKYRIEVKPNIDPSFVLEEEDFSESNEQEFIEETPKSRNNRTLFEDKRYYVEIPQVPDPKSYSQIATKTRSLPNRQSGQKPRKIPSMFALEPIPISSISKTFDGNLLHKKSSRNNTVINTARSSCPPSSNKGKDSLRVYDSSRLNSNKSDGGRETGIGLDGTVISSSDSVDDNECIVEKSNSEQSSVKDKGLNDPNIDGNTTDKSEDLNSTIRIDMNTKHYDPDFNETLLVEEFTIQKESEKELNNEVPCNNDKDFDDFLEEMSTTLSIEVNGNVDRGTKMELLKKALKDKLSQEKTRNKSKKSVVSNKKVSNNSSSRKNEVAKSARKPRKNI